MNIDEFFDTYFEGASDTISGFGVGSLPHFLTVVDLMSDKTLAKAKEKGLSYPILVLQEFDDSEDTDDIGEVREQQITGVFAVLTHVDIEAEGHSGQRLKIRECRSLAKKVFSKMIKDSISLRGNTLFDNNINVDSKRESNYVYQVAGTLSGYLTRFTWYVKDNLIQD